MNKEIIEKVLLEISTPTGLTYSGDTTICNDEVKDIMNYINNLEQQVKKQKEVIDRIDKYIKENIYSYYDSKGEKCIEETVFERSANPKELLDILNEGKNEWDMETYKRFWKYIWNI